MQLIDAGTSKSLLNKKTNFPPFYFHYVLAKQLQALLGSADVIYGNEDSMRGNGESYTIIYCFIIGLALCKNNL